MSVKTIRNIDEKTWRNFKSLATKLGVSMGELLSIIVEKFRKENEETWKDIFDSEKLLSEDEAKHMMKISEDIRDERGFRE